MANKYSTSVNIIRDANRELVYYPTPNAITVANQIGNDFKKGLRSFNIIGSYGTGKSSFLWAMEQSLQGTKRYFEMNLLANPTLSIINFIGEFKSIHEVFADYLGINHERYQTQNILSEIYNRYHDIEGPNPLLVIVIDEFGKFLEYAAKHDPERELYFIQQFTEFVNNSDYNICLITTVHQNFDAYAFSLDKIQRQEWTKVKGRFREITFNEPVEQLLYLASEHLDSKPEDDAQSILQRALKIAQLTKAFRFEQHLVEQIANKLFPLDLLAASVLTLSLQRYGQNERSLFSFLESTDHTGLGRFRRSPGNPFYNVANVYDYLIFNFYSYLSSKDNADLLAWTGLRSALEAVERNFDDELNKYEKLVKTIGLLAITTPKGSVIDKDFLINYARTCLGINDAAGVIDELDAKKIIRYRKFNTRYILFEGTDLDIQLALNEAGNKITDIGDIASVLDKYYDLPPVQAKMYTYRNGTPRVFEYKISESPIDITPSGEIDGYINLIFSDQISVDRVKEISGIQEEAIIYGYYQNVKKIKDQLFEIEKTNQVIIDNLDDKIAIRELENVLLHHKRLLNYYLEGGQFTGEVVWIFEGKQIPLKNQKELNNFLSKVCGGIYYSTPTFKNELVNRHRLSGSISDAKKKYIKRLTEDWASPDLGFDADRFPPEKTIYITLLKQNGVQLYSETENFTSEIAKDSSFRPLWDECEKFLIKSKKSRLRISELIEKLSQRPFKLKQGLIDFWIPTFLFLKRNDFALFGEDAGYIPNINADVLEMVGKIPHKYEIKGFDFDGVRLDVFNSYRNLMQLSQELRFDNRIFIETIKPLLVFYKGLPEYAKNTRRLNRDTIAVREAIARAKDPERLFFEELPTALGYSVEAIKRTEEGLVGYAERFQEAIRQLRTCQDELITRFENVILEDCIGQSVSFEVYQSQLQNRFSDLKKQQILLSVQKTFIQRIDSELEDRSAWLNGLAQALVGRGFEKFRDEDELLLHERFKRMIFDLDSLTNLSSIEVDTDLEEALGLEITSFAEGIRKNLVRLPKNKMEKVITLENEIRRTLTADQSLNIVALTNILKELLAQ